MTDKHILHMLTPLKHMSPFDVNMALDAGYDAAIAYTNVMLDEVGGLVQDAIFSRPPKTGVRTGMFIGGKNAILALDMLSAAKKALYRHSASHSLPTLQVRSPPRRPWWRASRSRCSTRKSEV